MLLWSPVGGCRPGSGNCTSTASTIRFVPNTCQLVGQLDVGRGLGLGIQVKLQRFTLKPGCGVLEVVEAVNLVVDFLAPGEVELVAGAVACGG